MKPSVTIRYCSQCNWMLRATWMAQELLHTFAEDLQGVTLEPVTGGAFEIVADGTLLWERKRDGGFPSAKELKRRLRDLLFPDRELGHLDRP
ncbi:SelT/SelW/SelH family protein [Microbulbifer guangxiensis]|uniref:SelT/SelW/SelH family protein n=1 Tax=Microbulbifer guangxiensis TaxID=2904249 RepID=UPI001F2D935C|nr:SelT/SelW/SelH family protein [Microbulbifer guangxiensis]